MKNNLIIASIALVMTVVACQKKETLANATEDIIENKNGNNQNRYNNLQKIVQDKDMIQFVMDNSILHESTKNMDYILEISHKNENEINQNDLALLSDAFGFQCYENFESFFVNYTERIATVNSRYNIETLSQDQLEFVFSRILSNNGGKGIGKDIEQINHCVAKYNACVAQVYSVAALGVITCTASGPAYIVCAIAVGVGTVGGLESCRLDLIACKEGKK